MPAQMCQFVSLVVTVFNFVMAIFPLLGLGTLFYGAVMWATASSEPQKLEQAKKTLTYGVIGFILGLSSIVILLTVENMFLKPSTGPSTNFTLSELGSLKVNFCLEGYFINACDPDPCIKLNSSNSADFGTNCKQTSSTAEDAANGIPDGGFVCCPSGNPVYDEICNTRSF